MKQFVRPEFPLEKIDRTMNEKMADLNQKPKLVNGLHSVPDDTRYYYVMSYGGCGSTLISRFLENYGRVKHLHTRVPPKELEYAGYDNSDEKCKNTTHMNGIKVPEHLLKNFTVIYIYKDPVRAIYSRFSIPFHLKNVSCKMSIKKYDLLKSKKDLYGIEEFFDNWTTPDPERNYDIICVKYSDLFDKQDELFELLNLKVAPEDRLFKRETERKNNTAEEKILYQIYQPLIDKINSKKFIEIV